MRTTPLARAAVALCFVTSIGAPSLAAQRGTSTADTLTLRQAEILALKNYPDLRASLFDQFAANEAIKIAHANYEPQAFGQVVQAVAPGGTRIATYNALTDPTIVQRTAAGVGITQYITDFGRTTDLVQAAEADARERTAVYDRTRDTVLLGVTQAYYEVLRANALLVVADQTYKERHELLREVQALQRAGLRSTLDVAIAQRDASTSDQLVIEGRNRRLDAFADLTLAIGSPQYAVYTLADVRSIPNVPNDFEALAAGAVRFNPTIAETEAARVAADDRARAAARLTSPTIEGYGFFGDSPFSESSVKFPTPYAAAGVNLTVPIFTGGSLGAQRREAEDQAQAAVQAEISAREKLAHDVRTAYEDVKTARGNVDVTETIARTADIALHDTDVRYKIGLSTITDVSEAELARTQASIEATNARYDFIVQEALLEFASGIIAAGLPSAEPSK
jgi:outer membrane protein